MNNITSLANPLIKHIVSLHLKKFRTKHREFIAEGMRTIQTLIEGGLTPRNLFAVPTMIEQAQMLAPDTPLSLVTQAVMEKISAASSPSGILGQFAIPHKQPQLLTTGLVLAGISDPGNMGTLIRSAAAMGAKTVVTIEGTDPWSPKVVQASAGTIAFVSIHCLTWQELLARKKDLKLAALIVSGGEKPTATNLHNSLLIVGSESTGIDESWLADCDIKVTLPMPGNIESLNAAVAGSIALYLAYNK